MKMKLLAEVLYGSQIIHEDLKILSVVQLTVTESVESIALNNSRLIL